MQDPPEDAVVTVCGHVFCFQCVSDYLTGEDNMCPAFDCKEQLNADVIFSKATLRKCLCDDDFGNPSSSSTDEKPEVLKNNYSSSKIRAVLDILQTYCQFSHDAELNSTSRCTTDASSSGNGCLDSQTTKPTKAIIFSQWTRMLDLVEVSLNNTSIKYRRLDGTMSLVARDKAVKEFNTNPEVYHSTHETIISLVFILLYHKRSLRSSRFLLYTLGLQEYHAFISCAYNG